jgi:PAS domain S-box-containing protein
VKHPSVAEVVERQLEIASLSGEVVAVMHGIVDRLMELPAADGASLSTVEDGLARFVVTAGEDRVLQGLTLPLAETVGNECLRRGELIAIRASDGTAIARALTPGAGAAVLAPIDYDGSTHGILGVRSADGDAFEPWAVDAIRMLARSAGIALRNAEVVERLAESEQRYRDLNLQAADARANEDRLRAGLDRLQEIVRTQQEISALELDPDAVTAGILERAQRLAGADGAVLESFQGDDLVYRFVCGISADHVGTTVDGRASLSARVIESGEPAYAADTETDLRVDLATARRVGTRSLICAPLYREGAVIGVLTVLSGRPHAFDELAVETTRLMADFVSTVFRNTTVLEERRRLVETMRSQSEIVEHMQTALWVWELGPDGEFRVDYANQASERATSLPFAEIRGRTMLEVLPRVGPRVAETFRTALDRDELIDMGEVSYGDERIEPSVFSLKAFPLPGQRIAVTFENVTQMVQARQALQESESRFRSAFHSTSMGMALTGLDGSFVQVNERLAEMLGYTTDELMSLSPSAVTEPGDFATDAELVSELIAGTRDSYQREKRYVRKDGSLLWAELTASVVRSYDGGTTHVVAHVQDITERKEANMLFAATFERSVVPMLIADDDRRVVDLNGAGAELLGVPSDEAFGLTLDEILPEEPVAQLWDEFMRVGMIESEVTLRRPDGGLRPIEFAATAEIRPGRHIAVVRDLSRQNDLESQLRQAQKMEAVGRLAGGIAHDFNNLLTAISGYGEFLADGIEDEHLRRHAEEITKAAARAASLTGQLLAFSRRQVLQPRVLDLNAVVSDMDMMLRRLIGEDVELRTMLDPQLFNVLADPTQVEQVIVNLAVNARDAMPNGGSVAVETANVATGDGDFVELRLTDTGIGMTEDERRQLFDPFFTTKQGGTGLGLATVYGIVEQSGGTIEVDSAPGMGSSFRILLPGVEAPADESAPAYLGDAPADGSETILLVEDEGVVLRLVAEILETAGYQVLQAGDGPSALELLRRHAGPVELLVTDVVMPGMSGPEVAQAVISMRPGTQVLYTSGYTDSAIVRHGALEPGIAFLQKPFGAEDLTRKVRSLLDRSPAAL